MRTDLRFAFRTLARAPLFTGVAVLSLALGIGANTAIFSVLHQVLLRMLPVRDPQQVVAFHFEGINEGSTSSDNAESVFSYPMYRDFRDRSEVFDGVIARSSASLNVIFADQAERTQGELVSGNFFEVLGVRPALGRLFNAQDDVTPGAHPVAVLSHGYWTRRFAASPAVINQTARINGISMTIVGVAARDFRSVISGQAPDVYLTLNMKGQAYPGHNDLAERRSAWLTIFGRLKKGVSRQQAETAMAPVYRAILDQELAEMRNPSRRFRTRYLQNHFSLRPGSQGINQLERHWKKPLIAVMGMVGLVLLIACANVANLMISRAAGRRKEIAIRLAVGASRWALIRQLLVESVLLSACGGLLGLVASYWISAGLIALVPSGSLEGWVAADIDPRMIAFTAALSLAAGLLFGLAPALSSTRPDVVPHLKDQGAASSKGQVRFRQTLVAAQIGLSLVLLIGAGLFTRSFANLLHLDLGFRPERLMKFTIQPVLSGYKSADSISIFDRLLERLRALPGVTSAAAAQMAPLSNSGWSTNVTVEGYRAADDERTNSQMDVISAGYFKTFGVPLVAGREFTDADSAGAPKVAIVNEAFAERFFKGRNPLGFKMIRGQGTVIPNIEIVGVVKDAKYSLRGERQLFYYLPYRQEPAWKMSFFVRAARDDVGRASAVRAAMREIDPRIPVYQLTWMQTEVEEAAFLERLIATLAAAFGSLATLLAAVGLYGVLAYTVARRTVEIGVRMALGASRGSIFAMVMREVGLLAAGGLALGIPCALAGGKFIETQLFGLRAQDPWVIAGAALVLTFTALLAGYFPARRAVTIDPLVALRYE